MDPVTMSIGAALRLLQNAAVGERAKSKTREAYEDLKRHVYKKSGSTLAPQLIKALETVPMGGSAAQALQQKLSTLDLCLDADILAAAQALGATLSIRLEDRSEDCSSCCDAINARSQGVRI